MSQPRYHDQDDVVGFCGDMRHPRGCEDGPPVQRVDELPSELRQRIEALEKRVEDLAAALGVGEDNPQ